MDILLNERRSNVLDEILHRNSWVRIEDLAQQFHVSNRTIRYDLDAVDDFLRANHLPRLLRKQNSGVKFPEISGVREKTAELLSNLGLSRYVLSVNERVQQILAELFYARGYLTIGYLADQLWVSRGTVNKDLQRVRDWLEVRNLALRSITKYGIKLVGNERDIRQAILQLLRDHIPVNELVKRFNQETTDWGSHHFIGRWLENVDIAFLQKCEIGRAHV
jgi:mannitol operon transcriptional antiterminator